MWLVERHSCYNWGKTDYSVVVQRDIAERGRDLQGVLQVGLYFFSYSIK